MNKKLFLLIIILLTPVVALADFQRDLYFGLKNDAEVTELQGFLKNQGLYSGPITGNFFSLTKEAVKKFQEREKINPAAGYFGPLTRMRANALVGISAPQLKGTQTEILAAQIKLLQAQLEALQKKLAAEQPKAEATTTITAADTVAPVFTRSPKILKSEFISNSPFGAHYPYKVIFDWAVDETGFIEEYVACFPALKIAKPAGRNTEYFPEPHTGYSCNVEVKDQAGNKVSGDIKFTSPGWVSTATGEKTTSFPDVVTNPFKIGEFTVYNGTTSDILLADFEVALTDEMDSTFNRGQKVNFILRDGPASTDTLISKTEFTFITTPPKIGEPHKSVINLPYAITLKPGNEKFTSLWVEQLQFVKSGTLKLKSNKLNSTTGVETTGGFEFTLTKTAGL